MGRSTSFPHLLPRLGAVLARPSSKGFMKLSAELLFAHMQRLLPLLLLLGVLVLLLLLVVSSACPQDTRLTGVGFGFVCVCLPQEQLPKLYLRPCRYIGSGGTFDTNCRLILVRGNGRDV